MKWQQGRATLDGMIARGELERVPASREHADLLLSQARRHLGSAGAIAGSDPAGAYQLLYDAARKSLAAVLENQGVRATSRGGHIAVRDAVSAQLDPPLGAVLRPLDRLRRRRNEVEYPSSAAPTVGADDVERDLPKVEQIIDVAAEVLDQMSRSDGARRSGLGGQLPHPVDGCLRVGSGAGVEAIDQQPDAVGQHGRAVQAGDQIVDLRAGVV